MSEVSELQEPRLPAVSEVAQFNDDKTARLLAKVPNGFVILFGILLLVSVLTYILPAGTYDKMEVAGKMMSKPGSFHFIDKTPVSFFQVFTAIPNGMQAAAALIFMILLIGGAVRVFDSTGAIKGALSSMLKVFGKDKGSWVIAMVITLFALIGAFPSMFEATIPFAPICMAIALALGYDAIVGVSMALVGVVIGWTAGPTNPWTVGIGQSIGQLPMFSGFLFRFVILVVLLAAAIVYILRYGNAVKNGRRKSITEGIDVSDMTYYRQRRNPLHPAAQAGAPGPVRDHRHHPLRHLQLEVGSRPDVGRLHRRRHLGRPHRGVQRLSAKIADEFVEGGKEIFMAALAVGLARSIQVVTDAAYRRHPRLLRLDPPLRACLPPPRPSACSSVPVHPELLHPLRQRTGHGHHADHDPPGGRPGDQAPGGHPRHSSTAMDSPTSASPLPLSRSHFCRSVGALRQVAQVHHAVPAHRLDHRCRVFGHGRLDRLVLAA